jgi:hypothetical protein
VTLNIFAAKNERTVRSFLAAKILMSSYINVIRRTNLMLLLAIASSGFVREDYNLHRM